jgi:hypothetical protein
MTEPAKDTTIDIAPNTQATQGSVPQIVSEINRTASRADGRNKKESDHRILETPAGTDSQMQENVHLTLPTSLTTSGDSKQSDGVIDRAKARFNALKLKYPILLAAMLAYLCFEESGALP